MTITRATATGAELKISFGARQVAAVLERLGVERPGKVGQIFFLDDHTIGAGLPLLDAGVILRLRRGRSGSIKSTVKLRPARSSQLVARWIDPANGVKLEHDLGLRQAVLAASLDGQVEADTFELVRAGQKPLHKLFDRDQRELLADCGPIGVNLDQLHLFGPITSERWDDVRLATFGDAAVEIERWEADGLEFIEVSAKVHDVEGAGAAQLRLAAALAELGLIPGAASRTKTEQMLQHLADADRGDAV